MRIWRRAQVAEAKRAKDEADQRRESLERMREKYPRDRLAPLVERALRPRRGWP